MESALRRAAVHQIYQQLEIEQGDMDVETVIADDRAPAEWTAVASSVPFLGDRRVVLVRNLLRVDPAQTWDAKPKAGAHPFVDDLAALPPTAMLVLVADDEQGDEDRQRRLETVSKRWHAIVEAAGGYVPKLESDDRDIADRLRAAAKDAGKHMTPSTATLLTEMTGGSLSIALGELDKAVVYVGDAEAIQDSAIMAVVEPEQEYNVYQLVDAIVAGDSAKALRQVRTMISGRSKIEGQAFSRIFPTIARQFRLVWQARLCLDANTTVRNPAPSVLEMFPSKPRIEKEREWLQRKAVGAARRISFSQIQGVIAELVEADAQIKGLRPSISTAETMETMVLRMAALCR